MSSHRDTLLCRYQYDALDRLVVSKPSTQSNALRFYLGDHLATEIQGTKDWSFMQHEDQLLVQQQRQSGAVKTRLLGADQQRSLLNVPGATQLHLFAYTPYGHRNPQNGLLSLLGFNGQRPDPVTGWYLLGNGYRAFNPVLMRFNSPDSWSPFGEGGLNAYAYCLGDPINLEDRTGHSVWSSLVSTVQDLLSRRPRALGGMTRLSAKYTALPRSSSSASSINVVETSASASLSKQFGEKKLIKKIRYSEFRLEQANITHNKKLHTLNLKKEQKASTPSMRVADAEVKYWDNEIERWNYRVENLKKARDRLFPRTSAVSIDAPSKISPAGDASEIRKKPEHL